MARMLPTPTATSAPYWEACARGELKLQQCKACGKAQFYPRILCSHCQASEPDWVVATGHGKVASFTIMHHSVSDDYPTPLVVALIDLDEGPRMMSHIVGAEAANTAIGDRVTVTFENWQADTAMPVFTLDAAS